MSLGTIKTDTERPLLSLFPLDDDYEEWGEPEKRLTSVRDYNCHNILVFESQDAFNYRNFVYNELNAILTMISYDYLQATGVIPLINMISHSTGGPWNMMWANRHPHNVHSMFAIAGTFRGSEMGTAIREDWLAWYTFSVPYEMINDPSSFDNTDTYQRDFLMAGWQSAVTENPNIRLYTLAGETCWYLLANAPPWWGTALFYIMLNNLIGSPFPPVSNHAPLVPLVGTIAGQNLLYYILDNSRNEWFDEGELKRIILSDDVLVSKSSASAEGFYNPNQNIDNWTKIFTNDNVNAGLAIPSQFVVPHNSSPWDVDTLNRIESNITMGTVLSITQNGNNVTIDGVNATIKGSLNVPEQVFVEGQYLNVSAIGASAFVDQSLCTEVILPSSITNIGNLAFAGCSSLTNITIPSSVTTIGDGAFAGCNNLNLSVSASNPNYTEQGNVLYSKDKTRIITAGQVVDDMTIPSTVTEIAPYAFEGNSSLGVVRFGNDPVIGESAFANCINLNEAYFYGHEVPSVGVNGFSQNNFVAYVPYVSLDAYQTALSQYASEIVSKEIRISFVSNQEVKETKVSHYGAQIHELLTLEKDGYTFDGWYYDENFTGDKISIGQYWETENDIAVYAKWIPKVYTVEFAENDEEDKVWIQQSIQYGSTNVVAPIATKDGYTFDGLYHNGTPYFNALGASLKPWNIAADTKLQAQWAIESYKIKIVANENKIIWLGEDGLSSSECSLQYGASILAINLIAEFKESSYGYKVGQIFDHFKYEGGKLAWTTIPDLGVNGAIVSITPIWVNEEHAISFNPKGKEKVLQIVEKYEVNIALPVIGRDGYTFLGWYEDDVELVEWTTMPDLSLGEQKDWFVTLFAHWQVNTYTVVYQPNGGVDVMPSVVHTYDEMKALSANEFHRTGHDFAGWSNAANGTVVYLSGQNVLNLTDERFGEVNLYAVWQAKRFTITYRNLMPEMSAGVSTYTYGLGLTTMPKIMIYSQISHTYSEMYEKYEWFENFALTRKATSISATREGEIILYAKYDYRISALDAGGTYTVTNSSPVTKVLSVPIRVIYDSYMQHAYFKGVKIEVSFSYWEKNDGYQHLSIYKDASTTPIWSVKNEHSPNSVGSNHKLYKASIQFDIADLRNIDTMNFKFHASGALANTWLFDQLTVSIYLTM